MNGANTVFEKLEKARKEGTDLDMKATLKELSFHVGGNRMHSEFWEKMTPASKGGGGISKGALAEAIKSEFNTFEGFKKEFTQTAVSVEGSGWTALCLDPRLRNIQ